VFAVSVSDVHFDDPVVQGLLAEWIDELGFSLKGGSNVEASDFTPRDGVFLVAVSGETPVGCGGVRRLKPAALALFRSSGYRPIPDHNGNPFARLWFEKRLGAV
jgi:hypothetical protein